MIQQFQLLPNVGLHSKMAKNGMKQAADKFRIFWFLFFAVINV